MGRLTVQLVGLIVALALIAAAGLLLTLYPWHPTTAWGWLLLVVLALPLMAAGEWLGNLVLGNRFARSIGRDKPPGRLSWTRIAYGVVALLVVTAALVGVFALLGGGLAT